MTVPYTHRMYFDCTYALRYPSLVPLPRPRIPFFLVNASSISLFILTQRGMGTLPVVTTQKKMSLPLPTTINYLYILREEEGSCKPYCKKKKKNVNAGFVLP